MLLKSRILKYFFPFSPFYFAFAEEGGSGIEDIVDEIDNILDEDDEGKPKKGEGDKTPPDDKGKSSKKELDEMKTRYDELSKNYDELKKATEKQQEFIDRITGADEEKLKKAQEAKERREWTEDTPNKVMALTEKIKQEFEEKLSKTEKKQMLKDIYGKLEREYDVDLKELSPKIVPLLDYYSTDAIQKNPEKVLKMCLKTLGKLKKRTEDIPFIQSGGGTPIRMTGEKAKKAEDKIRDRINKGVGGNGKETVFGI